jgi:hypothetical protein
VAPPGPAQTSSTTIRASPRRARRFRTAIGLNLRYRAIFAGQPGRVRRREHECCGQNSRHDGEDGRADRPIQHHGQGGQADPNQGGPAHKYGEGDNLCSAVVPRHEELRIPPDQQRLGHGQSAQPEDCQRPREKQFTCGSLSLATHAELTSGLITRRGVRSRSQSTCCCPSHPADSVAGSSRDYTRAPPGLTVR